jgi:hypothetical protein
MVHLEAQVDPLPALHGKLLLHRVREYPPLAAHETKAFGRMLRTAYVQIIEAFGAVEGGQAGKLLK